MSDITEGCFETPRKVLVTGASGFLGRHLVAALKAAGSEVVVVLGGGSFNIVTDDLPLDGVEHVFHLAAKTGIDDAWRNPTEFHLVNAHGTVRVLEQCRTRGCSMSYISAYVYGAPQRLPISESDPTATHNPYAFSKFMGEEACRFYSRNYGVRTVTLRLFNVYGPNQSERFLIPRIVQQVLSTDCRQIDLLDLAPKRDYIYISDVVSAILSSVRAQSGSIFNVGSGVSYSVAEVVEVALRRAGVDKPYRAVGKPRVNEVADVVADISAIRAQCGWEPRVSLNEGIGLLIEGCGHK